MKRLTIYTMMVLFLGGMALTLAHRAQTQDVTEGTAVPETSTGGATTPVFSYQGQLLDAQGNPVTDSVPMIFRLFPTATGGTACWTEAHTGGNVVAVADGRFSILLGSITPADTACLANDAYLELQINGETLAPRKLLTSVSHAVAANTLPDGAITRGLLNIASGSDGEGGEIRLLHGNSGNDWNIENHFGTFRLYHDGQEYFSVQSDGTVNLNNHAIQNFGGLVSSQTNTLFTNDIGSFRWRAAENVHVFIDKDNNQIDRAFTIAANSDYFGGAVEHLFRVDETKETTVYGFLDIRGMGNASIEIGQTTSGGNLYLDLTAGEAIVFRDRTGSPSQEMFKVRQNGDTVIYGNLDVYGTCNASVEGDEVAAAGETCTAVRITEDGLQTGAVIELNLMTTAERAAGRIDRFTQGDVLCWSTETERLEICDQANTRLVMAVANAKGLPIIQGAEPVKVIGPVTAGDLLVASAVPGYAMANNNPTPGTVLGKAMDNFNGESGLIKAMIFQW